MMRLLNIEKNTIDMSMSCLFKDVPSAPSGSTFFIIFFKNYEFKNKNNKKSQIGNE